MIKGVVEYPKHCATILAHESFHFPRKEAQGASVHSVPGDTAAVFSLYGSHAFCDELLLESGDLAHRQHRMRRSEIPCFGALTLPDFMVFKQVLKAHSAKYVEQKVLEGRIRQPWLSCLF